MHEHQDLYTLAFTMQCDRTQEIAMLVTDMCQGTLLTHSMLRSCMQFVLTSVLPKVLDLQD